jgi:hypothetical protein
MHLKNEEAAPSGRTDAAKEQAVLYVDKNYRIATQKRKTEMAGAT